MTYLVITTDDGRCHYCGENKAAAEREAFILRDKGNTVVIKRTRTRASRWPILLERAARRAGR